MRPLADLGPLEAARITVVAFDLDDTLLTDGQLVPSVYSALGRLAEAGYLLVAVTGRPLGYGEVLARLFPVLGVVVENGSLSVQRASTGALLVRDPVPNSERERRNTALAELDRAVRAAVPNAVFSDDMPLRRSELTYDVAEHRRLEEDEIARVVAVIRAHGAWATRSSVHVHATFDRGNKAEGLLRFLHEQAPLLRAAGASVPDLGAWRQRILFVGDSGNDAPCFAGFPCTVGVANVRAALASLSVAPRWVTTAEKGAGFRELAEHLLRLRREFATPEA